MAVPHSSTIPAILIAGATGLVALVRSRADAPRARAPREDATPDKEDTVMAYGSLSSPLAAGIEVRCLLTDRLAPDGLQGETSNIQRFERPGIIVELQPTRGRYGYQDVTVVVASADLPPSPVSGWVVEKIG